MRILILAASRAAVVLTICLMAQVGSAALDKRARRRRKRNG